MAWCKVRSKQLVYNSFEELLAILAEERRKTVQRRKYIGIGICIYLAVVFLLIAVMHGHHGSDNFGSFFSSVGGMTAGLYAMSATQKEGLTALAQFDDIRMVPRLIEALDYDRSGVFDGVSLLLQKLLPRLNASDAQLLSAEHHVILNKFLNARTIGRRDKSASLRLAILKALEQVGESSSLPVVEALASGHGPARKSPELQRAATECLPLLRIRAQQQEQTRTLLRAADSYAGAEAVLLRPANTEPMGIAPNELLRGAIAPDEVELDEKPVLHVADEAYGNQRIVVNGNIVAVEEEKYEKPKEAGAEVQVLNARN